MGVKAIAAVAATLVVVLSGSASSCDAGSSSITLGPGKHAITKSLRGVWKAEAATKGCRWTIQTTKGAVISSGQWTPSNREQWAMIGTGNVGMVFWPNDACGRWKR